MTATPDGPDPSEGNAPALPAAVRQRLIVLAAEALGRLPAEQIPAPLRAAARFTPTRRARLGGPALSVALAERAPFRRSVAEYAEQSTPDLVDAVRRGQPPEAADPVEVAALLYLIRPDGWTDLLHRAGELLRAQADVALDQQAEQAVTALRADLERARAEARARAEEGKAEVLAVRREADALRRTVRDLTGQARAMQRERDRLAADRDTERQAALRAQAETQVEVRRLRHQVTEAQDGLEAVRRATRDARSTDDARLWLLLETVSAAVQGLRRELAISPSDERPADRIASDVTAAEPDRAESAAAGIAARGDDPGFLDRLLDLPRVHLVVDGYNVTKTGYGELPLEAQRTRLVRALAGVAARTHAEVTCVFDGAERPPVAPPSPRGVRVLFSPAGVTADAVIRRLAAAEPPGRPVVVVSSDREVADGVRRPGVWPVAAAALHARLERG